MNATPSQPVLLTPRLRLRPIEMADAPRIQLLAGERDVAYSTMLVPHPYEDGMAEAWIETHADSHAQGLSTTFGIEHRQSGELIGTIGLSIVVLHQHAELGYWVGKSYWGNGYCTEAARAVLKYGFEQRGLHRIQAKHFVRNPASGRVMEKLGLQREGILREYLLKWGVFEDVATYAILASEFEG